MICWVITDGNAGARSQALGLVEALGVDYIEKKFRLLDPLRIFAPQVPFNYLKFKSSDSDEIDINHPPQILIACGSKARAIGPLFKRKFGSAIFTIYIQDPKVNSRYYDLIIAPKHDSITGLNVIKTNFALNRVNPSKLKAELAKFKHLFTKYRKPFNSILIGGDTKTYKMDDSACNQLIQNIAYIIKQSPGSVLITTSRRTPDAVTAKLQKLAEKAKGAIYLCTPNSKDNPFFAMLDIAESIFVTNDSVSMVSEACAAGKPVYAIPLLGHQNNKVSRMFDELIKNKKIFHFNKFNSAITHDVDPESETLQIAKKTKEILSSNGFKIL